MIRSSLILGRGRCKRQRENDPIGSRCIRGGGGYNAEGLEEMGAKPSRLGSLVLVSLLTDI